MPKDKYTAVWVSHSSISDYLNCPRAYFLNNIYKDPVSGNKISIISPPLALGQVVHEVLESLSVLPTEERFKEPLLKKYERAWEKISGKKGGFLDKDSEYQFKKRGEKMLQKVIENPGPIARLAVKIKSTLPYFWLSEKENIILCGKIDWLEYLPETDSVHIIDFKTSKSAENDKSLQLPIYHLIVKNCQKRKVTRASYWYLEKDKKPVEQKLPDIKKSKEKILEVAKKIKLARSVERFLCPKKSGCFACKPLEKVLRGEAEFVGLSEFGQNMYIINSQSEKKEDKSVII